MAMELNENSDERSKQVAVVLLNRETTSNDTAQLYDAFSKYYDQASIYVQLHGYAEKKTLLIFQFDK